MKITNIKVYPGEICGLYKEDINGEAYTITQTYKNIEKLNPQNDYFYAHAIDIGVEGEETLLFEKFQSKLFFEISRFEEFGCKELYLLERTSPEIFTHPRIGSWCFAEIAFIGIK